MKKIKMVAIIASLGHCMVTHDNVQICIKVKGAYKNVTVFMLIKRMIQLAQGNLHSRTYPYGACDDLD